MAKSILYGLVLVISSIILVFITYISLFAIGAVMVVIFYRPNIRHMLKVEKSTYFCIGLSVLWLAVMAICLTISGGAILGDKYSLPIMVVFTTLFSVVLVSSMSTARKIINNERRNDEIEDDSIDLEKNILMNEIRSMDNVKVRSELDEVFAENIRPKSPTSATKDGRWIF